MGEVSSNGDTRSLIQYIIKRLLLLVVTLVGITLITFFLTRLTPGEPSPITSEAAASDASGGYDSLLELNRRNLGLDKPMFLNLEFEDRSSLATGAVADFLRPPAFWQAIGETNLKLASTIALEPALEVLEKLQSAPENVDHLFEVTEDPKRRIDVKAGTERLLKLLPTLARGTPENLPSGTEEKIAAWKAWYQECKPTYEEGNVEQIVSDYLEGKRSIDEVLMLGGFAVPHLMQGLNSGESAVQLLANNALTGLVGYTYLSSPDKWEQERENVLVRWNSFYQRESARFNTFSPVVHGWNIVANTQLGVWFGQVFTLDFGDSYVRKQPVMTMIWERLPITFLLSFLSIFFSYLIAIPIGILSAIKKHTGTDTVITVSLFVLYSLPTFWVAQISILALTGGPSPIPGWEWPDLFPTRGLNSEGLDWKTGEWKALVDLAWHLVLPLFCMTYGSLAFLSRQMRSAVLETIKEDYIRTARAKGLSERWVIFRHALWNSLIPIITISAGLLPELIAGSIIIESIFGIPGMGLLSFDAILYRDYPVINAILFFSAALTLLGILIADLLYAVVDPRISYE
ncbi:MAG: ABC transporter permease subunit [Candidatus Sumerlaeia bacterium]|nr:ABC transporter permease subunit [Candidatus Sumerlaeia bacterium]